MFCSKSKNDESRFVFCPFCCCSLFIPPTPLSSSQTSAANGVKVKTFEEIMQEKRLRRQELQEQARGSPEAAPQKDPVQEKPKRNVSAGVSRTLASSSPPPTATQAPPPATAVSTGKLPARKLISLRSKAALVGNGETPAAATTAAASLSPNQSSSLQQQQQTDTDAPSQAKRARTLPHGSAADAPVADKTPRDNQGKVSSHVKGTAAPHFIHIYCLCVWLMWRQCDSIWSAKFCSDVLHSR